MTPIINTEHLRTMTGEELRDAFIHRERLIRSAQTDAKGLHSYAEHHLSVLEAIQAEIDRRANAT